MNHPFEAPASAALFARASAVLPGGVNSPVRAFRAVGGTPRFIARAQGPYLYDLDGHELVDLICSWGPMLLGHAHPEVIGAVTAAAQHGTSYGAPTTAEVELAAAIVERARDAGLLVLTAGEHTLRLLPPLVIGEDDVARGLAVLADVIAAGPAGAAA